MSKRRQLKYNEINLTALRTLPLLLDAQKELGRDTAQGTRVALERCRDALECHLRFKLRSERK